MIPRLRSCCFFFFNDTATTEIYTLSLHDALPICCSSSPAGIWSRRDGLFRFWIRSEEHTSELQSLRHLVCRLLLEKKKEATGAVAQLWSLRPPPLCLLASRQY